VRELTRPLRNAVDRPPLPPLESADDLSAFLAAWPDCMPLQNLVAEGAVDLWNFHYYESERTVHAVAEFFAYYDSVHGRAPRPLLSNEISCRPQLGGTGRDEARCLFKNLVAVQALGVRLAAWFGVIGQTGVVPWDSAGDDRPAAGTYRLLASRLGGNFEVRTPPERGPQIYRVDFHDIVSSSPNAVALWSWDDAPHQIELSPPFGGARARVFDYLGGAQALIEPGAAVELDVTADPVLIVWERVPLRCIGDCNEDGEVTIDEIIGGVNVALGLAVLDNCPTFDTDADGTVAVNELVQSVGAALEGCVIG
jgi:hypothetical protein